MGCRRTRAPGGASIAIFRLAFALCVCPSLFAQANSGETVSVHLRVDAGTPLRLYITSRVSYRLGETVHARFAEPVWSFDRIVIPAGAVVQGQVTDLLPAPRMVRAMACVRGDFTPLKRATVSFTSLSLPDGRSIPLDTEPSFGLASMFVPPRPQKAGGKKRQQADSNTKAAQLRRFIRQQARTQANARSRGLLDFVRGPNKREWIEDFFWSKLPYHPQRYRAGTRFDAVLNAPLEFGDASISNKTLAIMGTQPPPDIPALVRLTSEASSLDSHVGDPIDGVLSQPLFAADSQLLLPQGTLLTGHITLCQPARMFHRGGQLRFTFDKVKVPVLETQTSIAPERTHAELSAAEETSGSLQVDAEGSAKATESKTRFLRPMVAGLIAARSMDNDTGKSGSASGGANANYSGRELGGFSGFGLFGTAIARGPKPIGTALAFYGLAWSAYSTLISRGREVQFHKNSALAIRFGAPPKKR